MRSIIQIAQQMFPRTPHPFFITETVLTTDGPRTRICDGRYKTYEEADAELKKKSEQLG